MSKKKIIVHVTPRTHAVLKSEAKAANRLIGQHTAYVLDNAVASVTKEAVKP